MPDRGFPRGVVELAGTTSKSNPLRGGGTTIALAAVRAVHAADPKAWCAWIVPRETPLLYAPAVAQAGVDLDRLLVVRPPRAALARTVVKVGTCGAFDLVVVDAFAGMDGRLKSEGAKPRQKKNPGENAAVVVRKLALAAEEHGTVSLLLTDAYAPRPMPWPVALRLEIERRPEAIAVRVAKDRRGRADVQHVVRVAHG